MARNTKAMKRGWNYDIANSRLCAMVDGVQAFYVDPDAASTPQYAIMMLGATPTASDAGQVDGNGVACLGSRTNAFEVNADTGSTNLDGDYYVSAIKGNFVLGTTSSNASIIGVLGKLNTNTANFGSGQHFAVRGHMNFWGNSTLAGAGNYTGCISAYLENEATTTVSAGNYLIGVDVYQVGAPTVTGYNPAILIRSNTSGAAWVIGVDIDNATTAIDIGACTTGINVAANTVIPQLMTIGTSANPIHWDGVASNILVYQENTDTTPASVTANKFVLSAAQSGATTSGRLECFRATVTSYSTNNVTASMRSVVGQTEFAGACTYVGSDPQGCYGLIGAIHSGAALTATGDVHPLSLNFGVETNSALNGENSFIYMYNYGKVALNSLIQVYNGATPTQNTYLLDLQNAVLGSYSGPCYTGDVDPTGTTGDVALGADGHIKILVGETPYYIPIFGTLVS